MITLWVLWCDTKPTRTDVLYPNPNRTCKFTRMRPMRYYKREPKSEKPDVNANGTRTPRPSFIFSLTPYTAAWCQRRIMTLMLLSEVGCFIHLTQSWNKNGGERCTLVRKKDLTLELKSHSKKNKCWWISSLEPRRIQYEGTATPHLCILSLVVNLCLTLYLGNKSMLRYSFLKPNLRVPI